ncbi:dethiobiotin synthase [Haloimpatiens sp. FM7315]|uniref:dethiobiotin synthase n=1 Tax=Haloimpatiens sp. FM7315 TaxID=3298609 RepID=UPI0035A3C610
MSKGIFITGTDTHAGKTVVTAALMYLLRKNKYDSCYFKGALSGAVECDNRLIPGDAKFALEVSGLKESYENILPYVYKNAVSPHLASKLEDNLINIDVIKEKFNILKKKYDYIVMEGSGGIVCPLINTENEVYLLEDLIKELNMNVIVVARASLGTINHSVITVKYIESIGIKVKGIIINGYEKNYLCDDNIKMIKKLTNVPILAVLPKINSVESSLGIEKLRNEIEKSLNVDDLINSMDEI